MLRNHAASFQKSLACIGKAKFPDTFLDELRAYESNIDLGRYCDEGFPDPESIEFEIDDLAIQEGVCTVRVSCKFSEAVQTGCSDLAFGYPAAAKFDVMLDPVGDAVEFDYICEGDKYEE